MDDLVCVRIYSKRVEVQSIGGGTKLLVRKEDEKKAKEILEQYFHEVLEKEKAERGGK